MKLYALIALALGAIALPACAKPVDQLPDGACSITQYALEGRFSANVVLTNIDTDEVLYDGETGILVFQSAGAGTYWGGAVGTARIDDIAVDYDYDTGGYNYSLIGSADGAGAIFVSEFTGGDIDTNLRYEFTNLKLVTQRTHQEIRLHVEFGSETFPGQSALVYLE